ncbi:MAG: type II 3-dehydroquinate dehydratase, partial [Methylococcales bacterium]|nr:type II 3-dehydroquinate dehydratase [Methylococcales bacterium]
MAAITVINGPNLNLLGTREPELYGHATLASIQSDLEVLATQLGHALKFHQSNAEHEIIDLIHQG